jgi:aspartate racemase
MDNRCTMPSRIRAILYGEHRDRLIEELSDAVRHLLEAGATKIIFLCNTTHVFLDKVLQRVPSAEGKIINIIEACSKEVGRSAL